ncbi:hypothetical protein BJY59DRAFT_444272 [Rhodotorula toruloides]
MRWYAKSTSSARRRLDSASLAAPPDLAISLRPAVIASSVRAVAGSTCGGATVNAELAAGQRFHSLCACACGAEVSERAAGRPRGATALRCETVAGYRLRTEALAASAWSAYEANVWRRRREEGCCDGKCWEKQDGEVLPARRTSAHWWVPVTAWIKASAKTSREGKGDEGTPWSRSEPPTLLTPPNRLKPPSTVSSIASRPDHLAPIRRAGSMRRNLARQSSAASYPSLAGPGSSVASYARPSSYSPMAS